MNQISNIGWLFKEIAKTHYSVMEDASFSFGVLTHLIC